MAYAGTFTDKSGKPKSIVMWGQRVVVCGAADNCREIDLGVKGDWNPTTKTIGDGCVLERKYNRANGGGGDAVKSPGDYETSFTCGGAKLVTWYYDEEHMPTGYLMNALVTVPDADKAGVTGLCHSTSGDDAAPQTCAKGDFYGRWATAGPVGILKKLGKACGSAVPDCNPKGRSRRRRRRRSRRRHRRSRRRRRRRRRSSVRVHQTWRRTPRSSPCSTRPSRPDDHLSRARVGLLREEGSRLQAQEPGEQGDKVLPESILR